MMLQMRAACRGTSLRAACIRRSLASDVASDKYDVVVVGGGPGGYVAAIKASQLGLRTACVESRGRLGGTCLNVGCIPSKALLHSSHLFHDAKHDFARHGISVGDVTMDVGKMMTNKDKAVEGLTGGIEYLFKKYKVDYVRGFGKLSGPNTVSVSLNDGGSQDISTKNIVLAVGSEVTPLPPVPVDNAKGKIVDSTGALVLKEVPKKLAVVGGGYIGLEMGSVWNRLGSEVTVIEYLDRVCPAMDQEITKNFTRVLKKQGFKFKFNTKVSLPKLICCMLMPSVCSTLYHRCVRACSTHHARLLCRYTLATDLLSCLVYTCLLAC
jgi:dihydrolipoamide dehydrogenase